MKQLPADDKFDAVAFETIDREIDLLMKRLHSKGACPCCVSQALMFRGAFLHLEVAGPEDTIALCLDIVDAIEQPDDAEMSETQH